MRTTKRKSGNGTSNRQWLYLYVNVPLIVLVKVGISGDYKRRARQVAKSGIGWPVPVFAVRVPFAYQYEQAMHRLFSWFNVRYAGSREWYLFPIVPVAIGIMLLVLVLDWLVLAGMVAVAWWWLN